MLCSSDSAGTAYVYFVLAAQDTFGWYLTEFFEK
jgi:hypothetical protein